jgi:hypothetical protein
MRAYEQWTKRADAVPGYFITEAAGAWDAFLDFQETSAIPGHLAEIGVWKGKSASLLALHLGAKDRLALIDLGFPQDVRARLEGFAPKGSLIYVEQRSSRPLPAALASSWPRTVRFFHIDGEHTGEAVINDLRMASDWLSDTGLICLDDFFNPMYPQLTAAVFEYLAAHRHELTLVLCGHNKGYLCRPTASHLYLGFIRSKLVKELGERNLKNITVFKTTQASDMNCFGIGARFKDLDYYGLDQDPSQIPT